MFVADQFGDEGENVSPIIMMFRVDKSVRECPAVILLVSLEYDYDTT